MEKERGGDQSSGEETILRRKLEGPGYMWCKTAKNGQVCEGYPLAMA